MVDHSSRTFRNFFCTSAETASVRANELSPLKVRDPCGWTVSRVFVSKNDSRMGRWVSFNHTIALQMHMIFLRSYNGEKMC